MDLIQNIHVFTILLSRDTAGIKTYLEAEFGVHVAVHRDKFLIMKPTRCTYLLTYLLTYSMVQSPS